MNEDFGLLIDFLRGELDESSAAIVRARLENEPRLFAEFEKLRRTLAVLRSLPGIPSRATPASLPLTEPRDQFIRELQREYDARGWAVLMPLILPTQRWIAAVRTEFAIRTILRSLPALRPGASFVEALKAEYGQRALVGAIPAIQARPEYVRELREEFTVRASVDAIPQLRVREAFVGELALGFKVRSLVGCLPGLEVREGFARKLKVALFEAARETEGQAQATEVPAMEARDPFRRRLFARILFSSRHALRGEPKRASMDDQHWGRELKTSARRSRSSMAATAAVHLLAIAVLFFVTYDPALPTIVAMDVRIGGDFAGPLFPHSERAGGTELYLDDPKATPFKESHHLLNEDEVGIPRFASPDYLDPPPRLAPPQAVSSRPRVPSARRLPHMRSVAGWLRLRGTARSAKIDYLGSEELYDALDATLRYLSATHNSEDGSWGYRDVKIKPTAVDLIELQKVETTAAAVLAFLGDGHSSKDSPLGYDFHVRRGIKFLLSMQGKDGRIGPVDNAIVLGHAMATLALVEDYGMTHDPSLKNSIRRATRWLSRVTAADGSGGFPYKVGQKPSLMSSVWSYMALATARNARVPESCVPKARLDSLLDWFEDETRKHDVLEDKRAVLVQGDLIPSAAAGVLTAFANERGHEMRRQRFLARINRERPDLDPAKASSGSDIGDVRYLFFGSLAHELASPRDGRRSSWENAFADTVLKYQLKDAPGGRSGSFEHASAYAGIYGRVYTAAMVALSIENAYRVAMLQE